MAHSGVSGKVRDRLESRRNRVRIVEGDPTQTSPGKGGGAGGGSDGGGGSGQAPRSHGEKPRQVAGPAQGRGQVKQGKAEGKPEGEA